MSNSVEPHFRALLYAVADHWSGGPGLLYPSRRFALISGWRVIGDESPAEGPRALRHAVLIPEAPFSILPYGVRQASGILCEEGGADAWSGLPVPSWRGIAGRFGRAFMHLIDEGSKQTMEFPVQVLLQEHDPPGPRPEVVYLGMSFLRHYGFRLVWNYADLRFTAPGQVDGTIPVGALEIV